MKIVKWIASVVLLTGLTVSTASAATAVTYTGGPYSMTAAGELFEAEDPITSNDDVDPGPINPLGFTHNYNFTVSSAFLGLSAYLEANVTVGATSIADLTFQWYDSSDTAIGSSLVVTDGAGNSLFTSPNVPNFTEFLLNGTYYLQVTGEVITYGSGILSTDYDFAILTTAVPLPAAFWLFGSALVAFIGFGRRSTA